MFLGPYSQHFTFLGTYKWAQWAWVFVPDKSLQPSAIYHFSLLGPFVSYEENEVLWNRVFLPGKPLWLVWCFNLSYRVNMCKLWQNIVLWIKFLGPYSQHFTFLGTYKWAQWAWVFVPDKSLQPSAMYHFSLLGPFVSYEENEVLWNTVAGQCQKASQSNYLLVEAEKTLNWKWRNVQKKLMTLHSNENRRHLSFVKIVSFKHEIQIPVDDIKTFLLLLRQTDLKAQIS
jgi:hypothetical protein